ncbi:MAG: two-component regulator propeller domain-containing protein [Candidatus Eiseniibacteriota bacterium]
MRSALRLATVLLAVVLVPGVANAAWQRFQASAGELSDNSIFSLAEDPDGGIWIGTGTNAADHFDGIRWEVVSDSLPGSPVYAVLEDHGGRQWFGSAQGGLSEFDGRSWSHFGTANGKLPSTTVTAILEDRRGDVWFGTTGGLVRFEPQPNRWTTYLAAAGGLVANPITRLFEDGGNRLWVATTQGVSALDPTRTSWTSYTKTPGALEQDSLTAVCQDKRGRMWFGTIHGVYIFDGSTWQHLSQADGLPSDIVLSLARDSTGRMWIGGADGVVHTDGVTFRADRMTADGTVIGPVQSLFVDSSGNLWMGGGTYSWLQTQAQGLFRYDGVSWQNYFSLNTANCNARPSPNVPYFNVLPGNCVVTGILDHAGDRWFPTSFNGVALLDHRGLWSAVSRATAPLLSDTLSAIAEDGSGALWFGSASAGVSRVDVTRSAWQSFGQAEGLASDAVTTLFMDHAGDLWVGELGGVSWRHGGTWTNFLTGGFPLTVQAFAEDAAHQLWVMTDGGLYSIDAARASSRQWTTADGLPDNIVTALFAARDGSMWFGTGLGAAQLTGSAWKSWGTFGLSNDGVVTAIGEDAAGNVVVGDNRDVAVFNGSSWDLLGANEIANPTTSIVTDSDGILWAFSSVRADLFNGRSWHHVDSQGNGLASNLTNSTFEDALLSRWFTSYGGIAEYQPDRVAPQTVFVNHPAVLWPSRSASWAYGAAYGEVADVEFSYSWDGAGWTPWSPQTTFSAAGIADGTHTFQVRSRDWANNIDPTPATFTFEVDATPPAAEISSPVFGQPVRGRIAISGTAADARFHDFALQVRVAGSTTWTGPAVVTLKSSQTQVTGDTLGTWDTATVPDGDYELRLAVTDTLGLVGPATLRVIVDNVAPFANVTSPVRLVARDGGDVYTTNAEVHAYFPPNAFDADPLISVDSTAVPSAPDTVAGVGLRSGPAWSVGWSGASMNKPGVLELRSWAPGAGGEVWRDDGASGWRHLGGTVQPGGSIAIDLSAPGRYALFASGPAPNLSGGLSSLTLTPRAFSPNGNFAAREVAIGFSLARPGDYTVKVYNRAGRLVRVVSRAAGGTVGSNLVRWDGRGDDGHVADPGLYLVTVEALGETHTQTLGVVH